MNETGQPKVASSYLANPAVEAMLRMQQEMMDVRGTAGLETEEAVQRTVKELRAEPSDI